MNLVRSTVDHVELAELLPWFVNGTLDETERRVVQRHIEECAECREDVEMFAAAQRAVRNESPAPLVPAPNRERLVAALDNAARRPGRRPGPWIAAAATIAAVAITIAWQAGSRPAATPALFETATSPPVSQPINYVLEVQFVPGSTVEAHNEFFESVGASELAVPLNDRAYRVALGLGSVTLAQLEQYADQIEARPEVASARFVAVQLPVE